MASSLEEAEELLAADGGAAVTHELERGNPGTDGEIDPASSSVRHAKATPMNARLGQTHSPQTFTRETRRKLYTLSGLFGIDNLASGLVPL